MPLCTLFLVSLQAPATPSTFLSSLLSASSSQDLLLYGSVQRWLIRPSGSLAAEELLSPRWDVVVLFTGDVPSFADGEAAGMVADEYRTVAGVPSKLVDAQPLINNHLRTRDIPPLTGSLDQPKTTSSTQGLEATDSLIDWVKRYDARRSQANENRAVTMLNFLKFKEGMRDEYLKYGKAFAESIGVKRGGMAKVVGAVVKPSSGSASPGAASATNWNEIALAQYPTAVHFADMAASTDYQEVNHRHRLPALEDTCILCLQEVDLDAAREGGGEGGVTGGEKGRSWDLKGSKL